MRSAIASPAASSFALLTRRPEDRRCIEVDSELCDELRLRCAVSEAAFVLMVIAMMNKLLELMSVRRGRRLVCVRVFPAEGNIDGVGVDLSPPAAHVPKL